MKPDNLPSGVDGSFAYAALHVLLILLCFNYLKKITIIITIMIKT